MSTTELKADDVVERQNGMIMDYKEDWSAEEVLQLVEKVPSAVQIAILDSFDRFNPSQKEIEAAQHFLDLMGDGLHPANHSIVHDVATSEGDA